MKKNLIYIFADQWNKQVMGRYNSQIQTPAMDNFAQESLVFENAISTYPLCSPHRAALLTGKYPYSLGMWTNCKLGLNEKVRLHPNETTIGSVLKKAGYQTAYIGKWHLDASEMNFSAHPASGATHWDAYTPPGDRRHGFDFWYSYGAMDNHMNPHYWQDSPTQIKPKKWSPEAETDVALQYLADLHGRTVASQKLRGGERQSQRVADLQKSQRMPTESHGVPTQPTNETKPFCMFISWNPPHPPYDQLPEELANRYDGAVLAKAQPANVPESLRKDPAYQKNLQHYYGAVHGLDQQFKRILEYLQATGLDKDTYVVLSADHGDMLGAHGLMGKNIWYEESITIPCMIRGPHIEPGTTDTLFSSIDHMPTLLELLGVEIPDTVQGQSFAGHCVPVEATTEDESAKARSLKSIGSAESAGTKPSKRTNSAAVKAGEPNPEAVFLSMIPGMPDMVQAYHSLGLHHKCFGWRGVRTKTHTYVVDNGCTPGEPQKRWLYNLQSDPLQLKPHPVILGTPTGDAIAKKYDQILIQFLTEIEDPFIMDLNPNLAGMITTSKPATDHNTIMKE